MAAAMRAAGPKSYSARVDSREAAGYLRISFNTLNCWRSRREGPAFVKIGGKVRYRLAEIQEIEAAAVAATTVSTVARSKSKN